MIFWVSEEYLAMSSANNNIKPIFHCDSLFYILGLHSNGLSGRCDCYVEIDIFSIFTDYVLHWTTHWNTRVANINFVCYIMFDE